LNAYKIYDWDYDINDDCSAETQSTEAWYLVFNSNGDINWNASYRYVNGQGIDENGDPYYFGGTYYGANQFNLITWRQSPYNRKSCPDTGRLAYTYNTNSRHKWRGSGSQWEINTTGIPQYSGTKQIRWQGKTHAFTESIFTTFPSCVTWYEVEGIPWNSYTIATGKSAPSSSYAAFDVIPQLLH
jgi:hypothetical protein